MLLFSVQVDAPRGRGMSPASVGLADLLSLFFCSIDVKSQSIAANVSPVKGGQAG